MFGIYLMLQISGNVTVPWKARRTKFKQKTKI